MFESTIEKVVKTNEEDKRFLIYNIRKLQICDVIDSLTETEFLDLQNSVIDVFKEVENLLMILEQSLKKQESYDNTYQRILLEFQNAKQSSQYYQDAFFLLLTFLENKKESWLENEKCKNPFSDSKKVFYISLKNQFYQEVKEPIFLFEKTLQETLCSRDDVKKRILKEEDLSEIQELKKLYYLVQTVKKKLKNKEVLPFIDQKKLESLSTEEIYQGLILEMYHWEDSSIYEGKKEIFDYLLQRKQKQQAMIQSRVDFFKEKLDEIDELKEELSRCLKEKKRSVRNRKYHSIRNRLLSFIQVSRKDYSFNKCMLSSRQKVLLVLGFVPNHFMEELLSMMEFSLNIQRGTAKNMLFNTDKEDSEFVTEFLNKESKIGNYFITKNDFTELKKHINDKDVVQVHKELSHDRKLLLDFYNNYLSSLKSNNQELEKLFQIGKMDSITSEIRKEISNCLTIPSTQIDISKVEFYEQVMSAREVQEEEILNILVKKV